MSGVRAELAIDDLERCPVAAASESTEGPARDVTWADTGAATVEQFTAPGEPAADGPEAVFDYGDRTVYEFERDDAEPCFCEVIERQVGPVADVRATGGTLRVTVHVSDVDALRSLVAELSGRFGPVRLEYLVQTRAGDGDAGVVPVDVDRLTDRQREVLETAYEMGYFAYPRESNAREVAAALDIGPSTLSEHLSAAQSKLLGEILDRA